MTQPATTQHKEELGECAAGGHLAGDRRKTKEAKGVFRRHMGLHRKRVPGFSDGSLHW